MKQAGVKRKKEWLSARDDLVRPDHRTLDGMVVDVDQPFVISSEKHGSLSIDYPLDSNAPAVEVINCRCTVLPVLNEEGAPNE